MDKIKYGFQIRTQPQDRQPARPSNVSAPGFGDSDDDEIDTNKVINRDAKQKSFLKGNEEKKKKAIEEDRSVYEYDGVYDQMKEEAVRSLVQDQQEKKPKYMEAMMEKANERKLRHEIIHEKKLAKEMSKDEDIYADKLTFVTNSYKKNLADREQLKEKDRLRELREEKEDVTKKKDINDFVYHFSENKAFGAKVTGKTNTMVPEKQIARKIDSQKTKVRCQSEILHRHENTIVLPKDTILDEKPSAYQKERDHHKNNEDVLAAAQERYIARKRAKVN
ncbi:hypothetical protein ACHQM5_022651 [Ranunculus cassubicifolius]